MSSCELAPLGGRHSTRLTRHHILAKHLTRGNAAVRKAADREEFWADICDVCHAQTRRVESREIRAYLLRRRARPWKYGEEHMRRLVDGLPWKVKHQELTWKGLTGHG